ncbi:hypothetical protein GQ53DRAFT_868298 [Thozetella sp. PMI_491]|nr:hypothetical protein GQ53DRAFT_868298 [Thozetella sp. PMI_491]
MAAGLDGTLSKLADPGIGALAKVEAATELRDGLEHHVPLSDYPSFLERSMPVLSNILRSPFPTNDHLNQPILRNSALQILCTLSALRFPAEAFEHYAEATVDLLLSLVWNDNEDNVLLCMLILSNIVKQKHQKLAAKLPSLLDLVSRLFERFEGIVTEQLDNSPADAAESLSTLESAETTIGNSSSLAHPGLVAIALKGTQSLKVLSECATFALSIFQVYEHSIPKADKLFPLIISVLSRQAKAQEQAHKDAAANETIFTGVSPDVKNRVAFGEFIDVQVKTTSLLAYLLKELPKLDASGQFENFLPDLFIRLLKDCPGERPGTRRELINTIRSIIHYNSFLPNLHDLLDERVLVGDGLTTYETLRPLAYSMLADLIQHVHEDLQPNDAHKAVSVYRKNLLDSLPGTSFQSMSLNALLNMAEPITKKFDKVLARRFLITILNAMADKLAAINQQYPNAMKLSNLEARPADSSVQEDHLATKKNPPQWDETDIFIAGPIKTFPRTPDYLDDNRFMFKKLMFALKNILTLFKTLADTLSPEEAHVILKLVRGIPRGFRYKFSSEESEDFVQTFWNTCQHVPATYLQEEIPALKALARDHSNQSLIQDAVDAIESFKWSAGASDGCSTEIAHDSALRLHPKEFWAKFKRQLGRPECCGMIEEVCHAENQVLRDWGVSQVGDIINACSCIVALGEDARFDAIIYTVKILAILCSSTNLHWTPEEEHLDGLIGIAKELEHFVQTDQFLPHQVTDLLELIFRKWLKQAPETLDALLRLIDNIATGKLRALPNLHAIIYENIISSRSVPFLNTLVLRCLEVYASTSTSQSTKWHLLRDVVNPIVAMLIQRSWKQGSANIDKALIESIRSKIWKRGSLENPAEPRTNHADKEAFQLSALIVYHCAGLQEHTYQHIIDFAVRYIEHDDAIVKYSAYVVIAFCIAFYKATAAALAKRTYLALVHCDSDQCSALVLQGLKLMAPVMPERCQERPEDQNATWVVGLRQALASNGTSMSHMATLLEFLNGQSKLFYHSRDEIAILAIDCLYKVAPPSTSPKQRKQLAMGTMLLLWGWEHRRVSSRWSFWLSRGSANQFVITRMMQYFVELFIELPHCEFPSEKLARRVPPAVLMEQPSFEDLPDRAIALLLNLVRPQYWGVPNAEVPDILKKVFSNDETRATLDTGDDVHVEKPTSKIINGLLVYCVLVYSGSEIWIAKHLAEILEAFNMCFISKKHEVTKQVRAATKFKISHKVQRVLESQTLTISIKEKTEESSKSPEAWGFMGFILGLFWPWWMKPAKREGRSQGLETSCEKLPISK